MKDYATTAQVEAEKNIATTDDVSIVPLGAPKEGLRYISFKHSALRSRDSQITATDPLGMCRMLQHVLDVCSREHLELVIDGPKAYACISRTGERAEINHLLDGDKIRYFDANSDGSIDMSRAMREPIERLYPTQHRGYQDRDYRDHGRNEPYREPRRAHRHESYEAPQYGRGRY